MCGSVQKQSKQESVIIEENKIALILSLILMRLRGSLACRPSASAQLRGMAASIFFSLSA